MNFGEEGRGREVLSVGCAVSAICAVWEMEGSIKYRLGGIGDLRSMGRFTFDKPATQYGWGEY